MKKTKRLIGELSLVLCSALLAHNTQAQPSVSVAVSVPLPPVSVEIHAESDFYEPLAPQGEWVVVGSYGRCWRPAHVASDWRPYCNGSWQRTDEGWYWVSDEPWAWATYHYGRWDYTEHDGWYWMPQTQWAPAWVSWHESGGYVGWAPLQPSVTISVNGFVGFDQARISPRAFVFVEQRQFLNPIRPTMVVVNNTTIINKTVNITKTRIVNKTVVNEGPATVEIEKASGHKVQAVAVQELRHKEEKEVVARQHKASAVSDKKDASPDRSVPRKEKAVPAEKRPVAKPAEAVKEQPPATGKRTEPPIRGESEPGHKKDAQPQEPHAGVKPNEAPREEPSSPPSHNPAREPAVREPREPREPKPEKNNQPNDNQKKNQEPDAQPDKPAAPR